MVSSSVAPFTGGKQSKNGAWTQQKHCGHYLCFRAVKTEDPRGLARCIFFFASSESGFQLSLNRLDFFPRHAGLWWEDGNHFLGMENVIRT